MGEKMPSINANNKNDNEAEANKMAEQREMMKNTILTQVIFYWIYGNWNKMKFKIMDKSAQARLSNLILAKPEKGQAVENYIIQMAR